MGVSLSKQIVLKSGLAILIFLNFANAASLWLLHFTESWMAGPMESLFGFDREGNLTTLFNALLLLAAALLALWIGLWRCKVGLPWGRTWIAAALVLGFLFVDEQAGIHDSLDFFLMERWETSGHFAWPWVVAYGVLVLAVIALFARFFLGLPIRFRVLFGLAAILYVGGAIGFEMIAARHVESVGVEDFHYGLLFTVEENLEMSGCLLAIHALISYLSQECRGCELTVRVPDQ